MLPANCSSTAHGAGSSQDRFSGLTRRSRSAFFHVGSPTRRYRTATDALWFVSPAVIGNETPIVSSVGRSTMICPTVIAAPGGGAALLTVTFTVAEGVGLPAAPRAMAVRAREPLPAA